ncbi:MAG: 5-formyltetrahydrofolate cyclo-ligase [Taibaiella sp.]
MDQKVQNTSYRLGAVLFYFIMINKNKNQVRQRLRAQRRALSTEQQLHAATQVCNHITHLTRYRLSKNVAFYLSIEGELNPELLLLDAHQAGKHCYLPVLHSEINALSFLPYSPGDELVANHFGILEPKVNHEKNHIPLWQLDIIFMPLVAFDKHHNRLGMGKGYYDKTFAVLNHKKADKPYLIGLAYQMQEVDQLITEAHDIPLDLIVTEISVL